MKQLVKLWGQIMSEAESETIFIISHCHFLPYTGVVIKY